MLSSASFLSTGFKYHPNDEHSSVYADGERKRRDSFFTGLFDNGTVLQSGSFCQANRMTLPGNSIGIDAQFSAYDHKVCRVLNLVDMIDNKSLALIGDIELIYY